MAEKQVTESHLIVVKWAPKEIKEADLKNFIMSKSNKKVTIHFGRKKNIALFEFDEKDPQSVQYIKTSWRDDNVWSIVELYGIPKTQSVLVSNLPDNISTREIVKFFTNTSNTNALKLIPDMTTDQYNPSEGWCIMDLSSAEEAITVCDKHRKFKAFRGKRLEITRYYVQIEDLLNKTLIIRKEINIEDIDQRKFRYMKEYEKDAIEDTLQEKHLCAKIEWGITTPKVKLIYECKHSPSHVIPENWTKMVTDAVNKILDSVKVTEKTVEQSIWQNVRDVVRDFENELLIETNEQMLSLAIVGYDNERREELEMKLNNVKPPPKVITKEREVKDVYKLIAFDKFGFARRLATDFDAEVRVDVDKSRITVSGSEQSIGQVDEYITKLLLKIRVKRYDIGDAIVAKILSTDQMKDEVEILMKKYTHCHAIIEPKTLVVLCVGDASTDNINDDVLSLISKNELKLEGKIQSKSEFDKLVKSLKDIYPSQLHLTYKADTSFVTVTFTCPSGEYVDIISQEILAKLGNCLSKKERILVSHFSVKQILENKYVQTIINDMKASKIEEKSLIIDEKEYTIFVDGTPATREQVKRLMKKHTDKINISWINIEQDGIDIHFDNDDNRDEFKDLQKKHNCSLRIATIDEMKEHNVHCIVLLESGQAIFAGTGDLTNLALPADVIVNASNRDLDHKGGLARDISKAGGKAIQDECKAHIHEHGSLKDGDVFLGGAGKLQCLKIAHAVGPEWKQGQSNERQVIDTVVTNILKTVAGEDNCVLRSVAMPLISTGVFGAPRKIVAKVALNTLKERLPKFKSIRELFFYDPNAAVVREIQDQMEEVFGECCYHLPVQNVGLRKGTMTTKMGAKTLRTARQGTRTLPLPGRKKIIIVWGQLEQISADVLVNITGSAPKPSGNVSNALHKHAGLVFNLNRQVEEAFGSKAANGQVADGTLVVTKSGNIPCSEIFHVKIAQWDSNTGEQNVCEYTKSCLQEAVREKSKTIAFPTIGTYDFGYDQVKVARAMIRTAGEFMKLHIHSSLEAVKIVIYKTDIPCTAAFENVMENIYCQRPHRLEAVIDETNELTTNDEEDTNPDVHLNPSPNPNPKPPGGRQTFRINQRVTLELEIGYIEQSKTDAIVCTSSSFPSLYGAIANAIKKAGGNSIEKECKAKYKKYPDVGIVTAPGGRLLCKKVYVLKMDEYKSPKQDQTIYTFVKSCLEKADTDSFGSIAFPTIGTGGFKFPDITAATKTCEAIQDFCKRQRTSVDTIKVVMYPQAHMSIQTFTSEAAKFFGGSARHLVQSPAPTDKVTAPVGSDLSWNIPGTKTSIEISFGNLEAAQADVILNTTTSFPNLNGVISSSLVRVAGSELQNECTRVPHKVTEGDIAETKGYNLKCEKVFHYVLPTWGNSGKQKMIKDKIGDCLQLVKNSSLHSIALPSIGTGGYQYDPTMVANGIYDAASLFGERSADYTCILKLVLYPAVKDINKIFTDLLKQRSENKGQKKGVRFVDGNEEDRSKDRHEVKPRKVKDFVLIQITSNDPKKEVGVIKDIRTKIKDKTKSIDIDLKKDRIIDDIEMLKEKANEKKLMDIGKGYTTQVEIDLNQKKIHIKGMGDNVRRCHEKILDEMNELRSLEGQKKIGNVVHKYLEWCYTEENGTIWVPYPRRIAYMLEDAFKQNEDTKEFKDSDGNHYVVDFKKMTENKKDSKDKKLMVEVIRRDLTVGEIGNLPLTWSLMGQTENVKEVDLKPTDQEYKDVEAEFSKTLAGFNLTKIGKIKRIQNQALYQQYIMKKKQLETALQGVPDIERTLWHGIKADAEAFITPNGFDRGHAGQTFGGNLWYGQGTYFAVNSAYSADDNYSPAANDGYKRMYLVKVLTGNTTAVARGMYNDRFPPLLPGSTSDRYNSVCDDVNTPTEFVIFNDTQAYPEYMIYFK